MGLLLSDDLVIESCAVEGRMIHECGAGDGTRVSRGDKVMRENLAQCQFVHNKFYVTQLWIENGSSP